MPSLTQLYNMLEVGLWLSIAVLLVFLALRSREAPRALCMTAAGGFALFAGSDLVEIYTGAWWKPWWLLAWKAGCTALLVGVYVCYRQQKQADRSQSQ